MKRHLLLSLSALPLLLSGCSQTPEASTEISIDGMTRKEVTTKMVTHFGENFGEDEVEDSYVYSDYWFLEDARNVNYELASMSALVDGVSYCSPHDNNATKIANLLEAMGFQDVAKNTYFADGIKLTDSIGMVAANKTIKNASGKTYTLLALFPRNAGYGNEWFGNFDVGASGIHHNFKLARDEGLRFLKNYISTHSITGDLKVWAAGYSRGGATVNLIGGFLAKESKYLGSQVSLAPQDLYVYTIATPNTIPNGASYQDVLSVSGPRGNGYCDTNVPDYIYTGPEGIIDPASSEYDCVHSFVATGDYITKLPPKFWSFTTYGKTEKILYGEPKMREYLSQYSQEVADSFKDKNYLTETPKKVLDLNTLAVVDGSEKQSADAMIEERLNALMSLEGSREALIAKGYGEALGAIAGIWGTDWKGFYNGAISQVGALVKAAAFNVFAHLKEQSGLSEGKAIAHLFQTLFQKDGRGKEAYTDQSLLKDLFDFLINSYQKGGDSAASRIASFLPATYKDLYVGLLDYAKAQNINVQTVDDFLFLLGGYVLANKGNETIQSLLNSLAGIIPSSYLSYIPLLAIYTGKSYDSKTYPDDSSKAKAALLDLLECFAKGTYSGETQVYTPGYVRYSVLNLVTSAALSSSPKLKSLILNGTHESEEKTLINHPSPADAVIEEILDRVLPKGQDDKRMAMEVVADKALADLLNLSKTEKNKWHVDTLIGHVNLLREILFTILLKPGKNFDLMEEVGNALTFIDKMGFLFPAHDHELYLSSLKAKADA